MQKLIRLFSIIFLSIIIFSLISCASTRILPAPVSKDDTLLVIVKECKKPGGSPGPFSYYELKIQDIDKTINIVPSTVNNLLFVSSLLPGKHTTVHLLLRAISLPKYERMKGTKFKPSSFKVKFTLKPGYIEVFSVKFLYYEKMTSEGYVSRWDFQKITKDEDSNESDTK